LSLYTFGLHCYAQKYKLELIGSSIVENKIIDSLNYNTDHPNLKSLTDEAAYMAESLVKIGYIENKIIEKTKTNDSSYCTKFDLGKKIKHIHIYIGRDADINNIIKSTDNTDTITLAYNETEKFLNQTLQKLEQKGFALAKLKLINIKNKNNTLYADLFFDPNQQRLLNSVVVKFADDTKRTNFPEGHLHQINRKYRKNIFNQETIKKIHDDFAKFRFVNQIKYPEILLTKDTTKVYVYLEKRKSNSFDGFVGFTTDDDNKLTINGYLDLALENTLKIGEQLTLYWKNNGDDQKTFKVGLVIPYLFNSPIGLKTDLQIFQQDSTYQNTKTSLNLGYVIDYNTRIYLGYQSTESTDIQDTSSSTISDYENYFITSSLELIRYDNTNSIFSKKTNLSASIGYGTRTSTALTSTIGNNKQAYISLDVMHNFYLNNKNCFNINYHNYYLKSGTYITNELYLFGGANSIRGFTENSLQAHFLSALATEYRYIISPELYLHSILDYGYYQDKTTETKGNLFGFGFGFGVQTKNGILQLNLTNGTSKDQDLKSANTIVNINYNVKF
jgi:hypothetical protein